MALKILLADDNITAQKMGSKILTDAGYRVVPVSNGAAAIKKIASEKPELLILDVYMPGYTGLEVCQKVKSAPETAAVPVVLTVTNMEPFNPEDGNRVKADGVMIKPFEASDLLAVVQKFERKLQAPEPPRDEAEYQKNAKMAAVGFQDASYEEWKAEAQEPHRLAVPHEMAAAPALGMEDMLVEAPTPSEAAPAAIAAVPLPDLEPAPAPPKSAPAPGVEFTSAPQVGEVEVTRAPELELNGHAAPATEVEIVQDPALVTDAADMAQFVTKFGDAPDQPSFTPAVEPAPVEDALPAAEEEAIAAIPEITDPVETAAPAVSFEAPAESAPVQEAVPAEGPAPVTAPEAAVEEVLEIPAEPAQEIPPEPRALSLEEEMRRAFSAGAGVAAAPALALEPEPVEQPEPQAESEPQAEPEVVLEAAPFPDMPPVVVVEPPATAAAADKLVEQFAAELAQVAPAAVGDENVAPAEPSAEDTPPQPEPAPALDEQRVSEAVQRVMSRYKDELVAAIVRELKS